MALVALPQNSGSEGPVNLKYIFLTCKLFTIHCTVHEETLTSEKFDESV